MSVFFYIKTEWAEEGKRREYINASNAGIQFSATWKYQHVYTGPHNSLQALLPEQQMALESHRHAWILSFSFLGFSTVCELLLPSTF